MRFSRLWPDTSAPPSQQRLLDIALFFSLVPHLPHLKPMMLLYLVSALLMLFKKKITGHHLFAFGLWGGVALSVSFYDSMTYLGLSRLNIFVSLVVALLIVAVVLQRLSRKINFYILVSPALFLALSYFFNNSITMLFYAVAVLFLFTLLLLWQRMGGTFMAAAKMALTFFGFSLPMIVLLFLVFPRISFETRDFGFKGEETIRTGHDGLMHLGGEALLVPSHRVVMEVSFEGALPPESMLYFRGSTLYVDKTLQWEPLPKSIENMPSDESAANALAYRVTLYPHEKKWLFALDYPLDHPDKATRNRDAILISDEPVTEIRRYESHSLLRESLSEPKLSETRREAALDYDKTRDERIWQLTAPLREIAAPQERLKALLEMFAAFQLRYSLQPQGINPEDPVDSFLLDAKNGYCVHFAGALATMARMAGLPSRIVTGFKATYANGYGNYLIVRESDAHAWVEIYLEGSGWQRVEPTRFAFYGTTQNAPSATALLQPQLETGLWHRIQLYYMYGRYTLQSWVLDYNRSKQMQLLNSLLHDIMAWLKLFSALAFLFFLGYLALKLRHQTHEPHEALRVLQPLLYQLEKQGFVRDSNESMEHFLKRVSEQNKKEVLGEVSALYHAVRYGDARHLLPQLRQAVKQSSEN